MCLFFSFDFHTEEICPGGTEGDVWSSFFKMVVKLNSSKNEHDEKSYRQNFALPHIEAEDNHYFKILDANRKSQN